MKRKLLKISITFLLLFCSITLLYGWGAWAHKHINHSAVFALPPEMRTFYYNHLDFITEGAVVPDLRRGLINDKAEPPRHYIDLELFGNVPIENLPRTIKEATTKYDSAFLQKTGFLPWYIQTLMDKLTLAFNRKNKSEILFLSAELGHYLADAHVPLHTTVNHDGQLTNQKSIHSFWESKLPELFGDRYNFYTGDAKYIDDIVSETWRIIKQSYSLVDTVLATERKTRANFPKDKLYQKDAAGKIVMVFGQPAFSDEYAAAYNEALNGMVEKQLRLSIADLANFWYTAWVNGGKPDLNLLDDASLIRDNKRNFRREMKAWKKGRIMHLSVGKEY